MREFAASTAPAGRSGEHGTSSQDCQGFEPMTANTDDAVADHEPTKKVLDKVAKLQAEIDAMENDEADGSGHRLNRTSDADDVDPIHTPPANTAHAKSSDIQADGNQLTFQAEKVQLLDEMQRRQESYMRREDKLTARVEELEAEVNQMKTAQGVSSHDAKKEELRRGMEHGIRELLQKISDHSTCMEQEELLKFRQQLQSVEEEIKKERVALTSQQQAQVERMLRLQQELASTQALALKLEAQNKAAVGEAQRTRADLKCQQAETEEVLRQSLKVKRENEGLRTTVEALRARFEALFAEQDDLRVRLNGASGGSTREQVMQAEHARAIEKMRRMVATERARTKVAQSAQLEMQAKQGELQEVLRSLVDRVQVQHDVADIEAPTQPLTSVLRDSPTRRRHRSPLRTRSASRHRSSTPGQLRRDGSRVTVERMQSMSTAELCGSIDAPTGRVGYGDGPRRPASAAERSMQSAPLPMASESWLRRSVSAIDRVGHSCIHSADRRPSSAVEMPRSTRVAGGVVSVGTAGSWRPRSAFVARGSASRQPLGDMLDRAMAGSRLFPARSAGLPQGRKQYPFRQGLGGGVDGHDELAEERSSSGKFKVVAKPAFPTKKDIADQRRDKCQSGAKIETIVEEDLLDGDEENVVEEQLDVSWQPVS